MRTGLHANQTRDHTKILDYYRRSGSNVFKTLTFDDALLDGLKGLGVTIIGRLHRDRQELGGSVASTFVRDLVASARRHPQVDFWEGWNEAFHVASEIGRYAEFEIERMKALEAVGKKAAIGCFSTGTPEITDGGATWALFRPALEHARAHGHALALHEYGGPYMQYMTETPDGRNQWKQGAFTGTSPDPSVYDAPGVEGFLCLRYRKVYRLLRAWGIGDLQLFITEGASTTRRRGQVLAARATRLSGMARGIDCRASETTPSSASGTWSRCRAIRTSPASWTSGGMEHPPAGPTSISQPIRRW